MKKIPEKDLGHMLRSSHDINQISHDRLIAGFIKRSKAVFSTALDAKGNEIGVAHAMGKAFEIAGSGSIVASLPLLIAAKSRAGYHHTLNSETYHALSEENAGIDRHGTLGEAGEPVVVVVHGGGLLTPDLIRSAIPKGLTANGAAKYADWQFADLLKGKLGDGKSIELYTVDEVREGLVQYPFGQYGVWMNARELSNTTSYWQTKSEFMNHPLVLARAGTPSYLEAYFDKICSDRRQVGLTHLYERTDYEVPEGIILRVYENYNGLDGARSISMEGGFAYYRGVRK